MILMARRQMKLGFHHLYLSTDHDAPPVQRF